LRVTRLNDAEVAAAREERRKEIQMWALIREASTYVCFLLLLILLIYPNRHGHFHEQVNHLRRYFLNARPSDSAYTQVTVVFNSVSDA
jgi:hypothetical protein